MHKIRNLWGCALLHNFGLTSVLNSIMKLVSECVQGLGNTTLFCGDGINDLAALSAADVGMAVGATDAIVAASLSTRRGSVAGNTHCSKHL